MIKKFISIAAILCCSGFPSPTHGGDSAALPGVRDLTPDEASRAMEFVYEGKTRMAVDYLAELSTTCSGEPFFLIVKSRVAREQLPLDDDHKDQVKADAEPIHRDLERVIELCSQRLDGDDDPKWRLYRGLAWMSKAQLCSFSHRFWRAGRDAKKGKSDLEDYLEAHPDDPVALGTMGAFLYFAGTIPSIYKYLSKLVLMPTGDREKGLRYIETASEKRSYLQTEFQVVRNTIYLLFEGRFEDGIDGTLEVVGRYPGNPRIAAPIALMQPFDPLNVSRNVQLVDDVIARAREYSSGAGESESSPMALLEFLAAYAERFYAPPDVAEIALRRIADDDPDHPDWVGGYSSFELGRLLASLGESDEARTAFDWTRHNTGVGFIHGDAKQMAKALSGGDRSTNVPKSMWITEIYFGTDDDRANAIEDISSSAVTLLSEFYRGEALLIEGDMDAALKAYGDVLQTKADLWNEEFQMLAASRVAEIYGAGGDYDSAAHWLDEAMKYYRGEYLLDWVLEGRKRYYERLKDDDAVTPPRFLVSRP